MKNNIFIVLVLFLALASAHAETASSVLTVAAAGDGTYALQGSSIEYVAAMDITITYDMAALASPRVAKGAMIAGAVMAVNDTAPGTVRIGIIRTTPIYGDGVIATLTFSKKGDASGGALAVRANFSDINGKPVTVLAQIANLSGTASDSSSAASSTASSTGGQTSSDASLATTSQGTTRQAAPPIVGVIGAIKGDVAAPAAREPGIASTERSLPSGTSVGRGITADLSPSGLKTQQYSAIVDRFKEYKGKRTAKVCLALFQQNSKAFIQQEPLIALSDGASKVRVLVTASSQGGATPQFALFNARLLFVKRDNDRADRWVLEVLPEKGEHSARLIISISGETIDFPLTIAPRIDLNVSASGPATEKELDTYLSRKKQYLGKAAKNTFLDDYIVTANYLAAKQVPLTAAR